MQLSNKGFTLLELMIVVAVIGIISAIALPQYQNYIARTQLTEAFTMIEEVKISAFDNLHTAACNSVEEGSEIQGKYGKINISYISQTLNREKDPTGCFFKYTFNTQASPKLVNKNITFSLLNNGELVLSDYGSNSATDIAPELLPKILKIH